MTLNCNVPAVGSTGRFYPSWRIVTMLCLVWLLSMSAAQAATQEQIDNARTKAIAWLLSNQLGDGSWRSERGGEIQATAAAQKALLNAGVTGFPYTRSLAWMSNVEARSVDSLSRQILAMAEAGMDTQSRLDTLISWRNRYSAWGAYNGYSTTFPDTPLASSALRSDPATYTAQSGKLRNALCQIILAQKTGDVAVAGGWSYVPPVNETFKSTGSSVILPTVHNLLEIAAFVDLGVSSQSCSGTVYDLTVVMNAGVDWLLTQEAVSYGGGFVTKRLNDNVNIPAGRGLETALAYMAIARIRPDEPVLSRTLDYFIGRQNRDGTWQNNILLRYQDGDALVTAMVAAVLPATVMADTDKDGIPNTVELVLGMDPNVFDSRSLAIGNGDSLAGVTKPDDVVTIGMSRQYAFYLPDAGSDSLNNNWLIIQGELPDGMLLDTSTGLIKGTATAAGVYNVVVSSGEVTNIVQLIVEATIVGTPAYEYAGTEVLSKIFPYWISRGKIKVNQDGDIFVKGSFSGTFDFDPTESEDIRIGSISNYITRTNADGSYGWTHVYNTYISNSSRKSRWAWDIELDEQGNVYFFSVIANEFFLTKLDGRNGNVIATRKLPVAGAFKIYRDSVIVVGDFSGTVDFAPEIGGDTHVAQGYIDRFILKLDTSLNYQWARSSENLQDDYFNAIAIDLAGNIYVAGNSLEGYYTSNKAIYRYTLAGELVWVVSLPDDGSSYTIVKSMTVDSSGMLHVAGDRSTYGYSTKLDRYINYFEMFYLKLNSENGEEVLFRLYGTSTSADDSIINTSFSLGTDGSVIMGGDFSGSVNFDPDGVGDWFDSDSGFPDSDGFVTLSDDLGYRWSYTLDGVGIVDTTIDGYGNLYIIGSYPGRQSSTGSVTVDFGPGDIVDLQDATEGYRYHFITKFNYVGPPQDRDGDGINDVDEIVLGTSVRNPDTDVDGISDGDEVNIYKTDPLVADTDKDGYSDGVEILAGTDPLDITSLPMADVDVDGLPDVWESANGTNPLINDASADPDIDGYSNAEEYKAGTDPQVNTSKPEGAGGVNYVLFRDHFDDGQYNDRWYFGAMDLDTDFTLTEGGTELQDTVLRPIVDCKSLRFLSFATIDATDVIFHANLVLDGYGKTAIGLMQNEELNNRIEISFDNEQSPYLVIRSWDAGVLTEVSAVIGSSYQGGVADLRMIKTGADFKLYVNNAYQGMVTNNGLGDINLRPYLWNESCLADTGYVDNRIDLIELLLDRDGDGLADIYEDANTNGSVDSRESDPLNSDSDGDTVLDGYDNCTLIANANQYDSDSDGYGSLCDGDLDNSGRTNTLDLNLYKQAHRTALGNLDYNPSADFNGDGRINTLDLNIYKRLHRLPPGPSALVP